MTQQNNRHSSSRAYGPAVRDAEEQSQYDARRIQRGLYETTRDPNTRDKVAVRLGVAPVHVRTIAETIGYGALSESDLALQLRLAEKQPITVNDIRVKVDGLTESQRKTLGLDADGRPMPEEAGQESPDQVQGQPTADTLPSQAFAGYYTKSWIDTV